MFRFTAKQAGFTLVEVIIVSAISVMIFTAVFASFSYSLKLINHSRAKLSAISVANERMEFFRSLPYNSVGTISGIPPGTIPQNSTTTLNGIDFAEKVLVEYVDDPADGLLGADTNSIVSDYKRVRLEYAWVVGDLSGKIIMISNIVPRSIETTAGGGTIRINIIDADSTPLPGATVRLINTTTTSTIDVSRVTDALGTALFSGAPAASNYEVIATANISGNQYSTTGTYKASTTNPNPILAPFTVLEADISTLTMQIGELSDARILAYTVVNEGSFSEDFASLAGVASSTKVKSVSNNLVLEDTAGVYETNGQVFLGPITPVPLTAWSAISLVANMPVNTLYKVQLYTETGPGTYLLIPDVDLPGNSTGFTDTIIDISSINTGTYPALIVGISLNTTDTAITPEIEEISLFYKQAKTPLTNYGYQIRGNKIIGTDNTPAPVYKYQQSRTTDGVGVDDVLGLEFDVYTLNFTNYDIAAACPSHPIVQSAGEDSVTEFLLEIGAPNTLRVIVMDSLDREIPGAQVELSRPGYNVIKSVQMCGQAFFTGGLTVNNDYEITVSAPGYIDEVITGFGVDGDTVLSVVLSS